MLQHLQYICTYACICKEYLERILKKIGIVGDWGIRVERDFFYSMSLCTFWIFY